MDDKNGKIISINNFKGGVSKTSTACLMAYVLSEKKEKKVLVVDLDPQADATELLVRTFKPELLQEDNYLEQRSIYKGITQTNRKECTINLSDNLDIIPSDFNLVGLPLELVPLDSYKKVKVLSMFLDGVRDEYDIVIIDTPPTISDFSNNAIYACDYSLIVMQTHRRSFRAVDKFTEHLVRFKKTYKNNFDILGIIPVMFSKQTKTDMTTLKDATDTYNEHVFNHIVKQMERVKYWDEYGITEEDHWDKKTLKEYEALTDEFLERLEKMEG
ncbi:ParA family protein [Macrococcoides bohemicum]|uniref:ParA family protein n=1 Tax=Macrococcoides bohemicum TaxID=1903056 RepID=UPI00165D4D80|nr:ParA family protein [Macrococcus bohemicus]MBC9875597.1 ParA family protein [Macrococcus bohemicus]